MISRIMLSLRKAADEQQNGWSLAVTSRTGANLEFTRQRGGSDSKEDDIPLEGYLESRVEVP
jgi:hypothetical protein